ncbi:MAG: response regulator [Pseudomonadota bacterium]
MIAVQQQTEESAACDRILVVDGTRATRRILTALLARKLENVDVFTASTASEARDLLEQYHFDFLTTSAELPDSSGLALVEYVRALPEYTSTPAIIVSGDTACESGKTYRSNGTTGFFNKAEGFKRLIDYVRWVFEERSKMQNRVLCATYDSANRFGGSWQLLARCQFNLLQTCQYQDLIDTVRASFKSNGEVLDMLVVETDAGQLPRAIDLIARIRHDLHLPPNVLPALAVLREPIYDEATALLLDAGFNDCVSLPSTDALVSARIRSLATISQQQRRLSAA